jgi:hypothetical protein
MRSAYHPYLPFRWQLGLLLLCLPRRLIEGPRAERGPIHDRSAARALGLVLAGWREPAPGVKWMSNFPPSATLKFPPSWLVKLSTECGSFFFSWVGGAGVAAGCGVVAAATPALLGCPPRYGTVSSAPRRRAPRRRAVRCASAVRPCASP